MEYKELADRIARGTTTEADARIFTLWMETSLRPSAMKALEILITDSEALRSLTSAPLRLVAAKALLGVPEDWSLTVEPEVSFEDADNPEGWEAEECPHGEDPAECDACMRASDFAYDASRGA